MSASASAKQGSPKLPMPFMYWSHAPAHLVLDGYGYYSDSVRWLLASGPKGRYDDILGPNIGNSMSKVGWRYTATACRVVLQEDGNAVAAGWCSPIRDRKTEAPGLNLSYAVHPLYEGRGYAKVVAAGAFYAFRHYMRPQDANTFADINIQCSAENLGSCGLAMALGFARNEGRDFVAKHSDGRSVQYLGFASTYEALLPRSNSILAHFSPKDNEHSALVSVSRERPQ